MSAGGQPPRASLQSAPLGQSTTGWLTHAPSLHDASSQTSDSSPHAEPFGRMPSAGTRARSRCNARRRRTRSPRVCTPCSRPRTRPADTRSRSRHRSPRDRRGPPRRGTPASRRAPGPSGTRPSCHRTTPRRRTHRPRRDTPRRPLARGRPGTRRSLHRTGRPRRTGRSPRGRPRPPRGTSPHTRPARRRSDPLRRTHRARGGRRSPAARLTWCRHVDRTNANGAVSRVRPPSGALEPRSAREQLEVIVQTRAARASRAAARVRSRWRRADIGPWYRWSRTNAAELALPREVTGCPLEPRAPGKS